MITFLFSLFFKYEIRNKSYFGHIVYEIINITLTFLIIYYAGTSLVFDQEATRVLPENYLRFLYFGEIAFILPLGICDRFIQNYLHVKNTGFFFTMISFGQHPFHYVLKKTLVDSYQFLLRLSLMLFLGWVFLKMDFSFSKLIGFFIFQLLSTLFFISLVWKIVYFHWEFKRGLKFFYSLQTIVSILAGQFFPRSILPLDLDQILKYTPHSILLDQSRSEVFSFQAFGVLLLWTLFLLVINIFREKATILRLKRKLIYFTP